MASPHHRHQASLEGIIDFSSNQSLDPLERNEATRIFHQIISYCEPLQSNKPYKRTTLIRVTYEHTLSQDNFLRHFFLHIGEEAYSEGQSPESSFSQSLAHFATFDTTTKEQKNDVEKCLSAFADYLFDNFFLPLRASALKTPQPSPASLSVSQVNQQTGTTERVSTLRRDCLIRDHHRCIISRKFDLHEAVKRFKKDDENAKDDDGLLLKDESERPEYLEVAHILPHSLTSLTTVGGQSQLSDSKKTVLAILNMFDPGVTRLIEGPNIDRPTNALTLTLNFHQRFGDFEIYFKPAENLAIQNPHTYKIDSPRSISVLRDPILPVTRTLHLTSDHTIDPPSPRLLAIHHACGTILHLSGAGDHIDEILRDIDEINIKEDGSSNLGRLISLKVGGWLNGIPVH